jgi:hypothetical protein
MIVAAKRRGCDVIVWRMNAQFAAAIRGLVGEGKYRSIAIFVRSIFSCPLNLAMDRSILATTSCPSSTQLGA